VSTSLSKSLFGTRAETPAEQPDTVQIAQPLAIRHIALAARHVLEMPRVHQDDLQAGIFEEFVKSGSSTRRWLPSRRW
jgi:hypothetical protein